MPKASAPSVGRGEPAQGQQTQEPPDQSADNSEPSQCSWCGRGPTLEAPLLQCSGCQIAWYCDAKCQHAAWPSHYLDCQAHLRTENDEVSLFSASLLTIAAEKCALCRQSEGPERCLLQCSGCKLVWYCNDDCQLKDWPSHLQKCHEAQQLTADVDSRDADTASAPQRPDEPAPDLRTQRRQLAIQALRDASRDTPQSADDEVARVSLKPKGRGAFVFEDAADAKQLNALQEEKRQRQQESEFAQDPMLYDDSGTSLVGFQRVNGSETRWLRSLPRRLCLADCIVPRVQ